MTTPGFVHRFKRVTRALRILTMHPDGLPLSRLAAELDVDEKTLRDEIIAFYRADIHPAFDPGSWREVRIEFTGPDGKADDDDVEPADAEIVRASTEQPSAEIGVVHTSPAELANVFRAGYALLSVEPGNSVLAEALRAMGDTVLQGVRPADHDDKAELAGMLLDAIHRQRRVRVTYLPVWSIESRDLVVSPYRVLCTRRGWELDGSVMSDDASARDEVGTFLLSGIRHAEMLDEAFDRPDDVDRLIAQNRREHEADVVVPQDNRWVVDRFVERSDVLEEDEDSVKLRVRVLPPATQRLGIMMLVAGPDAFITAPPELAEAGRDLALDLLDHHRCA